MHATSNFSSRNSATIPVRPAAHSLPRGCRFRRAGPCERGPVRELSLTPVSRRVIHQAVPLSTSSLPRYLFTARFLQAVAYLPSFARLYWRLFRDARVSIIAKALLVLIVVYF